MSDVPKYIERITALADRYVTQGFPGRFDTPGIILSVAREWANIHGTGVAVTVDGIEDNKIRYRISISIDGTRAYGDYRMSIGHVDAMDSAVSAARYVRKLMDAALGEVYEYWKKAHKSPTASRTVGSNVTNHKKIVWLPVKDANGDVKDSYGRYLCQKHNFPMYEHHGKHGCPLCSNERRGWGFSKQHDRDGKIEVSNG